MPIQLTSSYSVGAVDPNSPYQQVKVLQFTLHPAGRLIELSVQLGNTVDGSWAAGMAIEDKTVKRFRIIGADYDTLVASASAAAGEVYYDKVAQKLYQWLIDNGHFAGTIV
jgi:hypothetical protein